MTFIYSDGNSDAINNLFQTVSKIKCAVSFLGGKVVKLISGYPEDIEIVCNLESGATNPYAVAELIKQGVKVKTNKKLHAKVYLALDETAIVGSANASANGLSYEDEELEGWIEAGIQVTDQKTLSEINSWFETQWELATDITPDALKRAKVLWRTRRNHRQLDKQGNKSILSLLKNCPQQFKDKNIYISIHRLANASKEACDAFSKIEQQLKINEKLSFWEGWSELPEDSHFISLYYGPRKGFEFQGYFYIPPNKSDFIKDVQLDNGEYSDILVCFLRNSVENLELDKKDIDLLKNKVGDLWKSQNPDSADSGVYFSLYESRTILFPNS